MADSHRPQRHRKSVIQYSDDNPSTFTVKRKRGEPPPPPPPPPPVESAAKRRAARAEGRRQQRSFVSLDNHSATPAKRGPGRPPNPHKQQNNNRRRRLSKTTADDSTSNKKSFAAPPPPPPPPKTDEIRSHLLSIQPVVPLTNPLRPTLAQRYPQLYQQNYVGASQAPAATSSNNNNIGHNWTRVVEAHKERWVPLQQSSAASSPSDEASLLALPAAPWTCFTVRKDDPLYFGVGDAAGNLLLYSSHGRALCIQTVLTSAAKREAERPILWHPSLAKGGGSHHLSSYPNSVGALCWHSNICVVWTRQEVEILDVVSHSTLFCLPLDLLQQPGSKQRQTFSFQSLDLHTSLSLLLWRPSGARVLDATVDQQSANGSAEDEASVSLYCIDFSDRQAGAKRKVIAPNLDKTAQKEFFCHAAVWDLHSTRDEMLVVISQPRPKDSDDSTAATSAASWEASLCRMSVEGEISQRTVLPESGGGAGRLPIYTDCVLEQYDDYLFLCTGRGIRCYETQRLTFLTVYGETVALHNKTVGWQACFWIPEPSFDPNEVAIGSAAGGSSGKAKKVSCWIQRKDELERREQAEQEHLHHQRSQRNLLRQESASTAGSNGQNAAGTAVVGPPQSPGHSSALATQKANKLFSNMLLVGVPHPTRGPAELQSTLYVWKPGQVLPLTTLQAPPGGLLGVHIHATHTVGWKLTCATAKLGQGWQFSATLKSDFAGTMYPVGYQIISDNIEYLEDEGELDHAIDAPQQQQQNLEDSTHRSTEDLDLQKALEQSLETAGEDRVSVLPEAGDSIDEERVLVPSIPDPSLREVFEEDSSSSMRSPGRRVRSAPLALTFFPQFKKCHEKAKGQEEERSKRRQQTPPAQQAVDAVIAAQQNALKMKGKRSRPASVEVMLQASVDPVLKHKMGIWHKEWSASGSKMKLISESAVVNKPAKKRDGTAVLLDQASTKQQHSAKAPPLCVPVVNAVTPSESSPSSTEQDRSRTGEFCVACHGRMVVHTCGRRELPVDTEALERAERARKEQEEAEQKRLRAERRRLAEAKRREARRKKKEEEERRRYFERMEEERRKRQEEERVAAMERQRREMQLQHYPFDQFGEPVAPKVRKVIPSYSELRTNGCNNSNNSATSSRTVGHGFHTSAATASTEAFAQAAAPASSTSSETFQQADAPAVDWSTGGNMTFYKSESNGGSTTRETRDLTSTTLTASDGDALAALVGLSASVGPPPSAARTTTPPGDANHYDYSGSSDRRSAILAQAKMAVLDQLESVAKAKAEATGAGTNVPSYFSTVYAAADNQGANGHSRVFSAQGNGETAESVGKHHRQQSLVNGDTCAQPASGEWDRSKAAP